MLVKEIMTKHVEMISSDSTVADAAKKMECFDIGILPVTEGSKIVGVLTDRDIVIRTLATERDPQKTSVIQVMTHKVFWCSLNDTVEEAAREMEKRQVHRLVVMSETNQPIGIISVSNLARKAHNEHLTCEVMEKICEPAHSGN